MGDVEIDVLEVVDARPTNANFSMSPGSTASGAGPEPEGFLPKGIAAVTALSVGSIGMCLNKKLYAGRTEPANGHEERHADGVCM